jgi:hypothetical protein
MRAYDLIGKRFSRLKVIGIAPRKGLKRRWLCRCDCGKTSIAFTSDLIGGYHKSCGCLQKEITGRRSRTHALSKSVEYQTWCGMKARCQPEYIKYKDYGGRGISVCARWEDSFENFLADMGPRPSGKYSIDRINNDGNYEPGNCRWATDAQQRANKRSSPQYRNADGQAAKS